jgi:UDP-N-acetylglucosamine 2-epimerase (non-hydrolysing)
VTLICNVVGARPNFMKMAPIALEMTRRGIPHMLVHTGQHYDPQMSQVFFEDLGMPQPAVYLGVRSGSHAVQTARVLTGFEPILIEHHPDLVVVGGDVNSTMACALAASKLGIAVAHIESGLRSLDRTMPEEINRVVADHLSDLLFTTEPSANDNLRREGIDEANIHYVGNCMVDTLRRHVDHAVARAPWKQFGVAPNGYGVVTLHRPSNVDGSQQLSDILSALSIVAKRVPLIFPVHPRTIRHINECGIAQGAIRLIEPLGYLDFLGLMARARLALTDSGGVQEETTALGVPCLTLRPNTERPITIEQGTNRLVSDVAGIIPAVTEILDGATRESRIPELWDGQAAVRTVNVIDGWLHRQMHERAH